MSASPTPVERLALKTANAAILNSPDASVDIVATVVFALGSAQLLQSPETAAELEAYRALELGDADGRVSAACADPEHPTWLRAADDDRGCPWCRVAELEAARERLADRMRAGQRWELGRRPALVSQDRVSQDELRAMFSIALNAPSDDTEGAVEDCPAARETDPARRAAWRMLARQRAAAEDPHDSPLHHDYRTPRDLPEVPRG